MLDAITIPVGPRLGNIVVEATGLSKSYGERTLFDGLSFSVPPASIVGAHAGIRFCLFHPATPHSWKAVVQPASLHAL